jgi:hypothetical protein
MGIRYREMVYVREVGWVVVKVREDKGRHWCESSDSDRG